MSVEYPLEVAQAMARERDELRAEVEGLRETSNWAAEHIKKLDAEAMRLQFVVGRVHSELATALTCLTDEFNAGRAGPSGLRAQAIAHVKQALVLLEDTGRA